MNDFPSIKEQESSIYQKPYDIFEKSDNSNKRKVVKIDYEVSQKNKQRFLKEVFSSFFSKSLKLPFLYDQHSIYYF